MTNLGPLTVYIVLKGHRPPELLLPFNGVVIEFDPQVDNLNLLLLDHKIPAAFKTELIVPPRMNTATKVMFRDLVLNAIANHKNLLNDGNHEPHRTYNVYHVFPRIFGYEEYLAPQLITTIPQVEDKSSTAFVIGNGPSLLKRLDILQGQGGHIFSCWHSASKLIENGLQPAYVGHLDPHRPVHDFKIPELPGTTRLIGPTIAAHQFYEAYPKHMWYLYLTAASYHDDWFCRAFNTAPHRQVSGTVTTMMIQSAIYAGYRKICLLGVDLCFENESDNPDEDRQIVYHDGKPTTGVMFSYKNHLEMITREHPNIHFYNASQGLKLDGYQAWN